MTREIQPQDQVIEQPMSDEEKDQQIAQNLRLKKEKIENFTPTGNIHSDSNTLLEITGRDKYYRKIGDDVDPRIVLANLIGLQTALEETSEPVGNIDTKNEAKKLCFIDIPQAELAAFNKAINYYLKEFPLNSGDQKRENRGDLTEKPKVYEISENADKVESEPDEEDEKSVAKWQEELDKFKALEISGDVIKDYNKIIELSEENSEGKLASPDEKKQDVLQKLVQTVEIWRYHLEKNESIKASPSREKMRSIFIDILRQRLIIGIKFIQYYTILNSINEDKE